MQNMFLFVKTVQRNSWSPVKKGVEIVYLFLETTYLDMQGKRIPVIYE